MTLASKMITLFLVGCVLMQTVFAGPLDKLFREDDERLNEVSGEEWFRKPIRRWERLFNSAETPSGSRKQVIRPSRSDKGDTTESSKHAHSMITSMLGFVSSVINLGRSMVRDQ
ncbi:uncharacterized protein LOC110184759 [Drosophila serrata]|uniref:uncharacterized protein LOC110184759 n=1 Tax=Drosophila serrata TaxID=7274 RepID=UPI000A1D1F43|nr:uncharacterized protein LOC110184759 [Drosophila serrata]